MILKLYLQDISKILKMKFFLIILFLVLVQFNTTYNTNYSFKGKYYYSINPEKNKYYRLFFINDSLYDIRDLNCSDNLHCGTYKLIDNNKKIILYDDDFYAMVFDTIRYNRKLDKIYLQNKIFEFIPDSTEIKIPYRITDGMVHYKKVKLYSMFNCEVIIPLHRTILRRTPKSTHSGN